MKKAFWLCFFLLTFAKTAESKNVRVPPIPNLKPGEAVDGEYIVKLKEQPTLDALSIDTVGRILGGVVKTRFLSNPNLLVLKKENSMEKVYQELYSNKLVEYVEPNYVITADLLPDDPELEKSWGIKNTGDGRNKFQVGIQDLDIGAEKAWDLTTGSEKVVVAIIDTGIDFFHPDLKDNIWINEKELNGKPGIDADGNGYVDDIYGYDFIDDLPDPMDDNGHGTHVAGTIGAKANNGIGVAGVNWNVKMMACKFLDWHGSGNTEAAIKAIDYAVAMGAKIANNSWGSGRYSLALKETLQRAADKGLLIVAAAGNWGEDIEKFPHYPASYDLPNIIGVASVDNTGELSKFSNYGKGAHLAAPGRDVYSTYYLGSYASLSGTSMATPHVTGVAALALSAKDMSMAELRDKVLKNVRPLKSLKEVTSTGGLVDAYKAVRATLDEKQ